MSHLQDQETLLSGSPVGYWQEQETPYCSTFPLISLPILPLWQSFKLLPSCVYEVNLGYSLSAKVPQALLPLLAQSINCPSELVSTLWESLAFLAHSNPVAFACQKTTPTTSLVVGDKFKTEHLKYGEPNIHHTEGQPIRVHPEDKGNQSEARREP